MFFKFFNRLVKGEDLGRTDKSEIERVEEQQDIFSPKVGKTEIVFE
jgi:hypothetical protein